APLPPRPCAALTHPSCSGLQRRGRRCRARTPPCSCGYRGPAPGPTRCDDAARRRAAAAPRRESPFRRSVRPWKSPPRRAVRLRGCTRPVRGCARRAADRLPIYLPRDNVSREVIDLTRHALRQEIVERQEVREDVEIVVRIGNLLRQEKAQQTAVRVAHRQRCGREEPQAW